MVDDSVAAVDRIDVLDHGFVRLDASMADDLSVVNAARVSFAQHVDQRPHLLGPGGVGLRNRGAHPQRSDRVCGLARGLLGAVVADADVRAGGRQVERHRAAHAVGAGRH